MIARTVLRLALGLTAIALMPASGRADDAAVERGRYLIAAGGCNACHTDTKNKGEKLAGGPAIKTPFGTFYGPNITPDPTYGIGGWSDADFVRALREGKGPGRPAFLPGFPLHLVHQDHRQGSARPQGLYFRAEAGGQAEPAQRHVLSVQLALPPDLLALALFYGRTRSSQIRRKAAEWNRGAYLTQALGHCGECHTPRTALGGLETNRAMAGTYNAPEKAVVPNITPDPETGIGKWSEDDIVTALKMGMLPGWRFRRLTDDRSG